LNLVATGPNRPGVITELVVQKVRGRKSRAGFRRLSTTSYVGFSLDCIECGLPLEGGWYATAYRFIDLLTLQTTPLMEAGIVRVSEPVQERPRIPIPVPRMAVIVRDVA
jgi:hypothetical protein